MSTRRKQPGRAVPGPAAVVEDDSSTETDDAATKTESDSATETDEDLTPVKLPPSFEVGEQVLADHNGVFYTAKVIKIDYRNLEKDWIYFVHYPGWNKNWDEWVGDDRLLKAAEKNHHKAQTHNPKREADKNVKTVHASLMKPRAGGGKKRKTDSLGKERGDLLSDKMADIQIQPTLKKQLIDDCEFVTHLGKLVKLPRSPNVDEILTKYLDYRRNKDGKNLDSVQEILKGIKAYFEKALPALLLYQNERQQYDDVITNDASPSKVYGAEHLLRLFVKLPELLVRAQIEAETLKDLQKHFTDFLKFLQRNQSAFFLSTYHVAEDVETSTNRKD